MTDLIRTAFGEMTAYLKADRSSEARQWFASFGVDPGGEPPDVFAALVRTEYARLGEVIRATGIKVE